MALIRLRDGNELFVRDLGRGQPVLLLHGFGSHGGHWLPNVLPLLSRYRFILPDLRGFGLSHKIPFSSADILSNYVDDVEDILDVLGLDKITLGGISMGAYAGLQFHRLRGFDRVSKYLHIDQSPQARNAMDWRHGLFGHRQAAEFHRFRTLLDSAERYGRFARYWTLPPAFRAQVRDAMADFLSIALSKPLHRWLVQTLKGQEQLMTRLFPVDNWFAYLDVMRAYMDQDYDMRPSLAGIRVPVTVMVGMRSRMYPPAGQLAMAAAIPQARVVRFEGAGHVPMIDQPLHFQAALGQFLAA